MSPKLPLILMKLWDLIVIGLIKMCTKFQQKNARKCLFYVQNSVWKTILKIPCDRRGIHGKLRFFTVFERVNQGFHEHYVVHHGLLGLEKGNDMYNEPPAWWFVTHTALKSKEQYTQYGHGFNFNYKHKKWYLISTTTLMGHVAGSKDPFYFC